jgi:hypothetical protein
MSTIKELAGTVQTLEASGASVSNNAVGTADDTDLDNTVELAFAYDFELNGGFGVSVAALEDIELYLVPKLDGTNLADKDTGTPNFQPTHYRGTFITPSTGTAARRMTLEGVSVGPYKYTAYIWNKTGVTFSSTWILKAFPVKAQNV